MLLGARPARPASWPRRQDGPVSWTAHADLAEAAAIILADEGRFDGPTPPLTGSEALDLADVAAIASELTGRPIRRVIVTDEQYRAGLIAHGVPEPQAADARSACSPRAAQGEFAPVDPALADLIGHPTTPLRDVMKAALTEN